MSEELKANNYTKTGSPFGIYESYTIGATTINELKKYKIVPNKDYVSARFSARFSRKTG